MVLVRVHNAIIEGLTSQGFNGQLTKFSFSKHTIFFSAPTPPPCLHIKSTCVENVDENSCFRKCKMSFKTLTKQEETNVCWDADRIIVFFLIAISDGVIFHQLRSFKFLEGNPQSEFFLA